MKFHLSLIVLSLSLASCGEKFNSQKPWDNIVAEGSLMQGSVSEAALSGVVNPFAKEEAASNYYFEESVLTDGTLTFAIYKSAVQGKLFAVSGVDAATSSSYDGVWALKVNRSTKEAYILLEKYSGEKIKLFADPANGDQFFVDGKLFKKSLVESDEMRQIPNKFCKMNVKSAGGEIRKLIALSTQPEQNSKIDFSLCIQTYKDYINESRDSAAVDNDTCKNLNKKYKTLTKTCKI